LAALNEILDLRAPASEALVQLRGIAKRMPVIAEAVSGFADRLEALSGLGVDVAEVIFEGSYGRTSLEYYDGFVFGFYADQQDWPPVVSGGRYDAMTRVLGHGNSIPAVGGVIRPELLVSLEAEA
jgi:ATP phosphoribosyltransferase regulatory subunit